MKTGTFLFLGGAALSIAVLSFAAAPGACGAGTDEAAVRARGAEFAAAWQKHDATALAALWTDDGDIINPLGRIAQGRAAVEKLFTDEHTGKGPFRESTLTIAATGETVRFPAPDVAVHDWDATSTGNYDQAGQKTAPIAFHATFIWKKSGGSWNVFSCRPYMKATMPAMAGSAPAVAPR